MAQLLNKVFKLILKLNSTYMKHLAIAGKLKAFAAFCALLFIQAVVFAQDTTSSSSSTSVTVTKEQTSDWFSNPWVWIIGAAVFILLLVALLGRGGSSARTDRTTVTKTVTRDTDTDL
jgi:fucose permease